MAAPAAPCPLIFARGFRLNPTAQEAVTYYLPRLVSGDLHQVVRPVIHRAQVHACDPADLARRFRPMPRTHNRFFFTAVNRDRRARGAAGPGSWSAQSTVEIMDEDKGVHKIGELRKFRYKKRGVFTDWLMEEYSSCGLDGAAAGGLQPVLCKVYVSPKAAPNSDAFRESAACFATPPPAAPAVITQPPPAVAAKRPAPPPPPMQDAMSPCTKRMRVSALQPAPGNASLPPPPQPSVLPTPPTRVPLGVVRKMPFAPPQPPCAPRHGSTASAPPLAPPAAVQKMPFAPPQAPSALPLAPPVLPRPAVQPRGSAMPLPPPPRPLAQPKKQQAPLTTAPVAMPPQAPVPPQLPIQSKQRTTILDPIEAAVVREGAELEEQTVAAAPATLQDDDDDDFAKELEDMLSNKEEEGDDDDFAKEMEDMLSAEAEDPALEFDLHNFFNFSEEDLEAA